jgi:prophage DNA circulation protein
VSWQDRIRKMIYVSPSGKSFELEYFELERTGGKKAPVTESPGTDGGVVQDLGNATPTYPVTCYISGPDYDTEADRFWDALNERGPGLLKHPRWGDIRVLPDPQTQTEQFVEGAWRATFSVRFISAPEMADEYPEVEDAPDLQIAAEADAAADTVTGDLEGEEITDPKALAGLKESVTNGLTKFKAAFSSISASVEGLSDSINDQINAITSAIDELVAAPAELTSALMTLYRLPARTTVNIRDKTAAYTTLYDNIVTSFEQETTAYGVMMGIVNAAQIFAVQIAAAESTIDGTLNTRDDALSVVNQLTGLNSNLSDTLEAVEAAGGFTADYESRAAAEQVATRAINNLIDRALNLPAEKSRIMSEALSPIELIDSLYTDIDDFETALADFIEYNKLAGNEILIVPRGREVRWYE